MLLRSLALAVLVACPTLVADACASDVWVDPINGDNANAGTGEADAWRTVTYALAQLGPTAGLDVDVVHLMPGLYSAPSGESFPLTLRDKVQLQGDGPVELIRFRGKIMIGEGFESTSWETGVSNITLERIGIGVVLFPAIGTGAVRQATLRSVVFDNKGIGVSARILEPANGISGVRIESCLFIDCTKPLFIRAFSGGRLSLEVKDSVFRTGEGVYGISYLNADAGSSLEASFERCLIRFSGINDFGLKISLGTGGDLRLHMLDCAVISPFSSRSGMRLSGHVLLERCTFAGHDTALSLLPNTRLVARDCLFGDNLEDLQNFVGAEFHMQNTIIDNPMVNGTNGNSNATPSFMGAAGGDYRLALGSPGIDWLPPMDSPDVDGVPRNQDGDLDTIGLRDVGAYETRTLFGPSYSALGAQLVLELQALDGELARLYISLVPSSAPQQSPFGAAWLPPGTLTHVQDVITTGATLTQVFTTAPAQASLAGTTIGFQALMRSPASATGAAWSSPLFLTLQ